MGKKQREERKVSVQLEPRRPSVGTATTAPLALADRPTSRVTIGEIVENSHDVGFEHHLPDSGSYFESIRIDPEGSAVVSPLYSHLASSSQRFNRRDSSDKDSFTTSSAHSGPPAPDSEEADSRRKSKRWAYKNVYGLSLAYVVLFTAFNGLQNLQSSIHSAGGLGLVTLSLLYAMFIVAGFVTPAFLKLFGTKYSLLFGFLCYLIYTLANYYPSWYTLVPASILIGLASAPIWAAASTHLAEVAVMVAPSLRKKQDYLISKFTGLTGILFSDRSDVAYSAMRIWLAVGFTIGFVIAELLSFRHRVWILLGTVTIAVVVNLILEFLTQSKEELLPCIYRKRHCKSRDSSESSSVAATKEGEGEGSNTSSPKLDITKEPVVDRHQHHLGNNSSVGQNPMFIMYGGRRPSTMSMWSADSLDGTLPSNSTDSATLATVNGGGMPLQQNGQNPLFVMYNGRRPSTDSVGSYRLSERGNDGGGNGRRLSAVSTTSADSLDGTRPLSASSRSESNTHHCETTPYPPPLTITTVPFVVGSDVPVRVLSPIHECEDDNEENPAITKDPSTSSSTIQRSNSYMSALDEL